MQSKSREGCIETDLHLLNALQRQTSDRRRDRLRARTDLTDRRQDLLRDDPAFVRELDFVMELDGELIGQNVFMKTHIDADDGRRVEVLTMGPIGIAPAYKRKGYGKKLLDYSLEKAQEMGFCAVLFEGNIGFYGHSGFDFARNFGIRYHDLEAGEDDSFFLCKELIPGALSDVTGVYQTPAGFYVDPDDAEAFDAPFPKKEKLKLPGQLFD